MVNDPQTERTTVRPLIGRCFVHPLFDYLAIGGGLSLITVVLVLFLSSKDNRSPGSYEMLPWIFLVSNSAHFAASTVRLYTKQGTHQSLPFVTMALPLVALGVVTFSVYRAELVGGYIQSLYLIWSPYHFSAQAYGLGVMYCYRSGCILSPIDKKIYWWIAMLPFFYATFLWGKVELLLRFVPEVLLASEPRFGAAIRGTSLVLGVLALLLPLVLYLKVWRGKSGPMPLISLLLVTTNAIWWVLFSFLDAFFWATVFHGIQYLAIVTIFHAREQLSRSDNTHGEVFHVVKFYAMSLALGYCLFYCWPQAYVLMGFGAVESVLLVLAAINIHHFIVDGYIWRLQKGDSNRRVVDASDSLQPAAAGV